MGVCSAIKWERSLDSQKAVTKEWMKGQGLVLRLACLLEK